MSADNPKRLAATCLDSQELVPLLQQVEAFVLQPNSSCHRFFLIPRLGAEVTRARRQSTAYIVFFAREKWTNFYAKALPSEQLTKTTFEPKHEPVCNRKVGHLGHEDVDQTCSSVCVSPSFPSCRWSCWRKR